MSQSFVAKGPLLDGVLSKSRKVLVTGAAGNIGAYFAEHAPNRYELRLMVREDEDAAKVKALKSRGEVVAGDLSNLDQLKELCHGVDTVLHLAASASPDSTWEEVLPNNIVGTYNMMIAAKAG